MEVNHHRFGLIFASFGSVRIAGFFFILNDSESSPAAMVSKQEAI